MRSLLLVPALALASLSFGLGIGDKAPKFKVETVVKGQAVNLEKGLHVVEFWATWCGPCKVSIPHLTELAHKYKGKVSFTGVSVWEDGEDQLGQVKKFVAAMGPKMDYNVAFDGAAKAMDMGFMKAAKQNGIPSAFLVKDGQVIWIGHPMDGLEEAIDQTVKGKFDVAKAKADFDKKAAAQEAAQKEQAELQKLLAPVIEAMQAGNPDEALAELDKIEAAKPELKARLASMRFGILLPTGGPKLTALATRFATDDFKDDADTLNSMAWAIIDPEGKVPNPNYEAALILSKQAAEASKMKDGMILDTYALALFKNGEKAKAVETQEKAVELSKTDKRVDAKTLKEMQDRLAEFKKSNV